jgi:hypothetical protein
MQILVTQEFFELDQKTWELLSEVPGKTILVDFYRLKNGGDLAFNAENEFQFSVYPKIFEYIISNKKTGDSELETQLILFSKIFQKIQNGLPSDDFFIDLKKKELRKSEGKR